ncbi:hypothetical protein N9J72_02825 [Candidatus Gracilibacteria bacterium]|nr:hypothetical protein [Candidatus Gracilibacteria bacterium]
MKKEKTYTIKQAKNHLYKVVQDESKLLEKYLSKKVENTGILETV